MVAAINFYASDGTEIFSTSGSGLAFFGDSGFGASIRTGEYNGRTYISNGTGTTQGVETQNIKWLNSASGILGQTGSGIALTAIPNAQCPLRIRFTNDTAVQVPTAQVFAYDRVSTSNAPSGVTIKAYAAIHPTTAQDNNGSGSTSWTTISATGTYLALAASPGMSGHYAGNGTNSTRTDTVHDFHVALSISPNSIGAKSMMALGASIEYL